MAQKKDYYEILGVKKSSSLDEIKRKYKKLVKSLHPDKNIGKPESERLKNEEQFKLVSEAYDVLSDEKKRKDYDMYGHEGAKMSAYERAYAQMQFKGDDIQTTVYITLEESYTGVRKKVKYKKPVLCDDCHGTGHGDNPQYGACPKCGGRGVVTERHEIFGGYSMVTRTCPHCYGTGTGIINPCKKCGGTGMTNVDAEIEVDVPKGICDGHGVKLQGYGGSPKSDVSEMHGDLIVVIRENKHEQFQRSAHNPSDLDMTKHISFVDGLIGRDVEINTIDGKTIKFNIKPNTPSESVVRLQGKGMPRVNNRDVMGDLFVRLKYEYPKNLTNEQIELLEKFRYIENIKNGVKPIDDGTKETPFEERDGK